MGKLHRKRYALEYKLEALRLIETGHSVAGGSCNAVSGGLDLAQLDQSTARGPLGRTCREAGECRVNGTGKAVR